MQLNKEEALKVCQAHSSYAATFGGSVMVIPEDEWLHLAEQILRIHQPNSTPQPPLPQAAVSGNEVAVCPRCSAEHSETDCHGYCTAACMQEDEGQTDR